MERPVNDPAAMHRLLCDAMAEGFCVLEVEFGDEGQPRDVVFLETNAAFERLSGMAGVAGLRMTQIVPGRPLPLLPTLAAVARGGPMVRVEQRSERLGRWFDVRAFPCGPPGAGQVGVVFQDVTQAKLDEFMAQSVVEYAIFMLDPAGHVRTWNAGAQRIKGYAPEEILGRHFSVFYNAADQARDVPAKVLQAAERGRFVDEGWRVRRDGSQFWASVAVTPLRDTDGKLQGFCKVTRDLSDRKRAEESLRGEIQERLLAQERLQDLNCRLEAEVRARTEDLRRANGELRDATQRLQQLSARLIHAQEQERGRIARELHDDTGQLLTAFRMKLSGLSTGGDDSLDGCMGLVDQAIENTRRLAMNLRPIVLDDLGLDAALKWLLDQQARLAGWQTGYSCNVAGQRFPGEVETACFRIAQEALTNAARHARAAEVSVSLAFEGDGLHLDVADDGEGFEAARARSPAERARHFGLVSMEERAGLVGARMSVESAPGRGTRVRVRFPLQGRVRPAQDGWRGPPE